MKILNRYTKEMILEVKGDSLREADLREADLWRADLRRADLREANLREADLQEANLWATDLRRADLRAADLWRADLRRADLREADLREADLWRADLRAADLRGANLDFSCWPLWCGSLGMKVDFSLICQLAYHFCDLKNDSMQYKEARKVLLKLANKSHIIKKHGMPKLK